MQPVGAITHTGKGREGGPLCAISISRRRNDLCARGRVMQGHQHSLCTFTKAEGRWWSSKG